MFCDKIDIIFKMVDLVIDFLMSNFCSLGLRMLIVVKRSLLLNIVIFFSDGVVC